MLVMIDTKKHVLSCLIATTLIAWCAVSSAADKPKPKKQTAPKFSKTDVEFFTKKVRPLLEARCFKCHSSQTKEPKGKLRLDFRAAVLAGGESGPAAVPGKPEKSALIEAIRYEGLEMPPRTKLPAGEIAILTKWVKMGLPWSKDGTGGKVVKPEKTPFPLEARKKSHWAWHPIQRHKLPTVKNTRWAESPIDRFILAKLEAKQLSPAPPASRPALIRRAYFDLIGLPPSPKEVAAFVNDPAPTREAFAKVVDRLLKSPHFGERWARHWLDLVRYAESLGHEFDYPLRHAYQYRDYVIRAFNADVPYNQFVTEHIAGDLLEKPRRHPTLGYNESIIGTGFWFLGEDKHAPVDVKAEEATKIDNQLDVFSKAFLGLAVGCARCHDHKFDPITAADYYALSGFLQSSRRHEALLDPNGIIHQKTAALQQLQQQGNTLVRNSLGQNPKQFARDVLTSLNAAREVLRTKSASNAKMLKRIAAKYRMDVARLQKIVAALSSRELDRVDHPLWAWKQLAISSPRDFQPRRTQLANTVQQAAARHKKTSEQSEPFVDFQGKDFSGWFVSGFAFGTGATQPGQWDSSQNSAKLAIPGIADSGLLAEPLAGVLRSPTYLHSHDEILYRVKGRGRIRLIIDGYTMDEFNALLFRGCTINFDTKGKWQWIRQSGDVPRYQGHRVYIEVIDQGPGSVALDEVRFVNRGKPNPDIKPHALSESLVSDQNLKSVAAVNIQISKALESALKSVHVSGTEGANTISSDQIRLVNFAVQAGLIVPSHEKQLADLAQKMKQARVGIPQPMRVIAITDGTPEDEYVFIRGNHKTRGPLTHRRFLEAISTANQPRIQSGSGRLELAKRMLDPANPFPSRVMVNRVWHHLFGRGIVASVDNFGVLGQRPTHPKLLDHLAASFMDDGWSVKRLIRRIMLSKTYRMSSQPNPQAEKGDPSNDLLHRMRIRRLQGEAIRDAMLAISGRLDRKMYGPSVPVYLTRFMQGRGRPRGGPLDGNGRRSIYISIRRNFLSPMMLAFDAPIPFSAIGRRNVSNVPAQALILMNDPFVIQQAQLWAKQLLADAEASPESRIETIYRTALSRAPKPMETEAAIAFLKSQADARGLKPGAWQTDPQVWGDFCHVMFNLKEFIFLR
ncbi:MAG: hypothetical protein Tsb009_25080 [Planctomycetaceae bacterium]